MAVSSPTFTLTLNVTFGLFAISQVMVIQNIFTLTFKGKMWQMTSKLVLVLICMVKWLISHPWMPFLIRISLQEDDIMGQIEEL